MSFKKGLIKGKKKQRKRAYTTDDISSKSSQINQSRRTVASRTTDDIGDKQQLEQFNAQRDKLTRDYQEAMDRDPLSTETKLLRMEINDLDNKIFKRVEKDLVDKTLLNDLDAIRDVADFEERKQRLDRLIRRNDVRRLGIKYDDTGDSKSENDDDTNETKVADLSQFTPKESALLSRKFDKISELVAELKKGNVVVIGDLHGNSDPFDYATLLIKLSGMKEGQLLIEAPQDLNLWKDHEFDKNMRDWSKRAWQNQFQANASIKARELNWDVIAVDNLNIKNPQDIAFNNALDRQYLIGTRIDNAFTLPGGKIIVFGRAHIEGTAGTRFPGSFAEWTGHPFSDSVKINDDKGDQQVWLIDRSKEITKKTDKPVIKKGLEGKLPRLVLRGLKRRLAKGDTNFEGIATTATYAQYGITTDEVREYAEKVTKKKK
ncbi:MAG: hypothetical protein F6J95_020055 [Leptolyngbya sp. SIO1E4]|nr:hypothetical protein [Leptolyngbya sp. SIO1E4]